MGSEIWGSESNAGAGGGRIGPGRSKLVASAFAGKLRRDELRLRENATWNVVNHGAASPVVVGRPLSKLGTADGLAASGLETRDTADWKSALRSRHACRARAYRLALASRSRLVVVGSKLVEVRNGRKGVGRGNVRSVIEWGVGIIHLVGQIDAQPPEGGTPNH
jgi:hypothetical protein